MGLFQTSSSSHHNCCIGAGVGRQNVEAKRPKMSGCERREEQSWGCQTAVTVSTGLTRSVWMYVLTYKPCPSWLWGYDCLRVTTRGERARQYNDRRSLESFLHTHDVSRYFYLRLLCTVPRNYLLRGPYQPDGRALLELALSNTRLYLWSCAHECEQSSNMARPWIHKADPDVTGRTPGYAIRCVSW
jgi:hypothetical protein